MLRLIGDIHGNIERYVQAIGTATETIQLGDFSTEDDFDLDFGIEQGGYHYILLGNHDNYTKVIEGYGISVNRCGSEGRFNLVGFGRIGTSAGDVFYVSGAESVDKNQRTLNHDWWPEEQLTFSQARSALTSWEKSTTNIVISHDGPSRVLDMMYNRPPYKWSDQDSRHQPSFTQQLLDAMLDIRMPSLWVFGHHHRSEKIHIGGTTFICLDEGETLDLHYDETANT